MPSAHGCGDTALATLTCSQHACSPDSRHWREVDGPSTARAVFLSPYPHLPTNHIAVLASRVLLFIGLGLGWISRALSAAMSAGRSRSGLIGSSPGWPSSSYRYFLRYFPRCPTRVLTAEAPGPSARDATGLGSSTGWQAICLGLAISLVGPGPAHGAGLGLAGLGSVMVIMARDRWRRL
jgi:hypothetical protein